MQFSLKFIGCVVFFAAISCVAVVNANRLWAQILFTTAVLLLLSSILAAVYSRGGTRAFWFGAGVFGYGYFFLAIGPGSLGFEFEVVTTRVLDAVLPRLQKEVNVNDADVRDGTPVIRRVSPGGKYAGTFVLIPTQTDFRILGHSLWVIVFAGLGGLFAKYLHFKVDTRAAALLDTVLEFAGSDYSHKRQQAEMAVERLGDIGATSALHSIVKKFSGSDDSHRTQIAARALELI